MATHFSVVIDAMLSESISNLAKELKVLDFQFDKASKSIYLNHDGEQIIAHAPLKLKAYIPKKWDGWNVHFIEFTEDTQLTLDLDEPINLYEDD